MDGKPVPAPAPGAAPGHAPACCPRCGAGFHCGAAGPTPCACATVTLPAPLLAALRARYRSCLCLRCLQALAAGAPLEPADTH